MDVTTVLGLLVGLAAVLGGHVLEGGHLGSILQLTAGVIVVGGTLGATLVAYPLRDFLRGLSMARQVLGGRRGDLGELSRQLVELAAVARRDGVLALEGRLAGIEDPFLRRALQFVVDGVEAEVTRSSLEAAIDASHQEAMVGAKVWESAGGFSPTIGILGAVLGLIHVMENLSDPSKLGGGIAVAFVATVYGVGLANLVYLPIAAKLKRKLAVEKERKTLIAEGVLSIQQGLNPRVLEEKLRAFAGEEAAPAEPSARPAKAA